MIQVRAKRHSYQLLYQSITTVHTYCISVSLHCVVQVFLIKWRSFLLMMAPLTFKRSRLSRHWKNNSIMCKFFDTSLVAPEALLDLEIRGLSSHPVSTLLI